MKAEKHLGQSFDSFLKEENVEISEDEIKENLKKGDYKIYIEPAYGKDKSCQIKYKVIDSKIYLKDFRIIESEVNNDMSNLR